LTAGSIFKIEKEIGADTKNSTRWNLRTGRRVFKNDTGDVDRVGIKLGT